MGDTAANFGPYGDLVAATRVNQTDNEGNPTATFSGKVFGFLPIVPAPLVSGVFPLQFAPDYHIAPSDRIIQVTPATTGTIATVENVDEDSLVVYTFDAAGVAESRSFYICVFRKGVGG